MKITCEPYGGLGNRLLTISSLYRISKMVGFAFEVKWVAMPTVIYDSLDSFFDVPFPIFRQAQQNMDPGFLPTAVGGRFAIPKAIFLDNQYRDEGLRIGSMNFYHCLWLDSDLTTFDESTFTQLTVEIRESLAQILIEGERLKAMRLVAKAPDIFDLGIHLRTVLPDDYRQKVESVWPPLDKGIVLSALKQVHDIVKPKTCFIASPDRDLARQASLFMYSLGTIPFTSDSLGSEDSFTEDEKTYFEFAMLLKAKTILRRPSTTFSAIAALLSSSTEYLLTDTNHLVTRRPVLFSGSAL
jgi:hypothetical protein